jgi:hypothetical protein
VEAARVTLQRNEELGRLVVSYVDSFHGAGSAHDRGLYSDKYSLMMLLERQLKWRGMDDTVGYRG